MSAPILATKLFIPPPRPKVVLRPRLIERLNEGLDRKLTLIAAEYRVALSISYLPMLLAALLGGLIIGCCISYTLLRFYDTIPTKNPILKSILLSFVVLIIATILLQGPSSFLTTTNGAMRSFLLGALFNVLRILALGIVIGYLYDKLDGGELE